MKSTPISRRRSAPRILTLRDVARMLTYPVDDLVVRLPGLLALVHDPFQILATRAVRRLKEEDFDRLWIDETDFVGWWEACRQGKAQGAAA